MIDGNNSASGTKETAPKSRTRAARLIRWASWGLIAAIIAYVLFLFGIMGVMTVASNPSAADVWKIRFLGNSPETISGEAEQWLEKHFWFAAQTQYADLRNLERMEACNSLNDKREFFSEQLNRVPFEAEETQQTALQILSSEESECIEEVVDGGRSGRWLIRIPSQTMGQDGWAFYREWSY